MKNALRSVAVLLLLSSAREAIASECDVLISSAPYTITSPGHYCLANSISSASSGTIAVYITADSVTLDLKGYEIDGRAAGLGTASYGIAVDQRSNVTIRNGRILGFYIGVLLYGGAPNVNNVVEDLTVIDSRSVGILVGWGASNIVRRCTVDNTGQTVLGTAGNGIAVYSGSSIVLENIVTRTLPGASGAPTGLKLGGTSRALDNHVTNPGLGTCFSFTGSDLYRDNTATGCSVAYSGGVAVGGTNFP
jgi:hypothetical protein